jgi:SAM-dependent methyltransferase
VRLHLSLDVTEPLNDREDRIARSSFPPFSPPRIERKKLRKWLPHSAPIAFLAEAKRITEAYVRRSLAVPAERYSPFELSNLMRVQELERKVLQLIARCLGTSLRYKTILEIGCGTGYWLRQFIQWGANPSNLAGVDILSAKIALARELCPPDVHLECRDASELSFPDGSFDIVWQQRFSVQFWTPQQG